MLLGSKLGKKRVKHYSNTTVISTQKDNLYTDTIKQKIDFSQIWSIIK